MSELLARADGILIPGGFGGRGIEGKIAAARVAREQGIPYLGICLGMQIAVAEFARNVAGMEGANSTEFDIETPFPVIDLLPEQKEVADLGGTMRLGADPIKLHADTRAREIYGEAVIYERHRHRYEVNNLLRKRLQSAGLCISGTSPDERLVEVVELEDHPFFVASQFHPEFKSRPERPAPLFRDFIAAALAASRYAQRGGQHRRRRAGRCTRRALGNARRQIVSADLSTGPSLRGVAAGHRGESAARGDSLPRRRRVAGTGRRGEADRSRPRAGQLARVRVRRRRERRVGAAGEPSGIVAVCQPAPRRRPVRAPPSDSVPVLVLKLRRAIVLDAGSPGSGPEQDLAIELVDGVAGGGGAKGGISERENGAGGKERCRPAIADVALVGRAEVGDELIVNVQALDLGLGSGGFDIVHVNLTRGLDGEEDRDPARPDRPNVMKLNYTSLQHTVEPVEELGGAPEPSSGSRERPVAVLALHGQLAAVAWAFAQQALPAAGSGTCRPWAARCPAGTRALFARCASAACWPGI